LEVLGAAPFAGLVRPQLVLLALDGGSSRIGNSLVTLV
jgi:hypothetical protein